MYQYGLITEDGTIAEVVWAGTKVEASKKLEAPIEDIACGVYIRDEDNSIVPVWLEEGFEMEAGNE